MFVDAGISFTILNTILVYFKLVTKTLLSNKTFKRRTIHFNVFNDMI